MKKLLALLLAMTLCVGLVACGGSEEAPAEGDVAEGNAAEGDATAEGAVYKDTIIWGQGADITSIDPHQGKETPAVQVTKHIFDTLFTINADGEVEGLLCEKWTQDDDVTYTFDIRQGVMFHDGSELTAEDVKFSLDRAIASASVSYIVDFIDSVEVTGDYQVKVTLDAPYAPALRNLAVPFSAIIPKAVVEADEEAFLANPIGTGPYKFVEWKQGESATLVANADYFRGAPATENLIMKVIPEAAQRTIALETGEIDLAYDIQPNDLARVAEHEDLFLHDIASYTTFYMSMNMNKAPFDNVLVREAVNHAIDRQLIVDAVAYGSGSPADSIIAPGVYGYYSTGGYEYNPELAKELLAEAGYADGFTATLYVNDNQSRIEVCQAIMGMLQEVGIEVEIIVEEFGTFINSTTTGTHDMAYFGWVTSTIDADYTYYSVIHSTQQGSPGNRTFINDPEADALIEEARSNTDDAVRTQAYEDLAILLHETANNAPIIYTGMTVGANKNVEGFVADPIGYHYLVNTKVAE